MTTLSSRSLKLITGGLTVALAAGGYGAFATLRAPAVVQSTRTVLVTTGTAASILITGNDLQAVPSRSSRLVGVSGKVIRNLGNYGADWVGEHSVEYRNERQELSTGR